MSTRFPTTEPTSAAPTAPVPAGRPPAANGAPRRRRRRWPWVAVVIVLVLGAAVVWQMTTATTAPPPTPVATPVTTLKARGRVVPVQQARVGTLAGGVVNRLPVVVGEPVGDQQEIARVRTPTGEVEVLTAPWAGTLIAVLAQYGDTVAPGATIAVVGDLSRLQVETTDVDEYLIGRLQRGQAVTVTIDALDGRQWAGVVQRITLLPQTDTGGDEHYPITIDLFGSTADLRLGMSVRLTFG